LPELLPGQRVRLNLAAEFAAEVAAYVEGLDVEVLTDGELVATSASSVTKGALVTEPLAFAAHTVEVINSTTATLAAGSRELHLSQLAAETLSAGSMSGPELAPGGVARLPLDQATGTLAVSAAGERCMAIRVYGDDGLVDEASGCGGAHARVEGGTYVEVVNLAETSATSWSVALRPVLDAGSLANDGSPASVQVTAGQAARLGFTLAAGSAVVFRLDLATGDCRALRVVDATDLVVAEGDGCGPDPVLVEAQLAAAAPYSIEVDDESPTGIAATFSVRAERLNEVAAGALAVGVDVANPAVGAGQRVRWDLDTGLPEPGLASLRVTEGTVALDGCVAIEEIANGIVSRHGQVCPDQGFEGYVSIGDGVDLRLSPVDGQPLPAESVLVRLDAVADDPAAGPGGAAAAAEINGSTPPESTGVPSTAAAVGCADVLFLGARGSGQAQSDSKGFGPQVYAALTAFRATLRPGISVEAKPLGGGYPANGVSALFPPATPEFFRSIQLGVDTGWSELNSPLREPCSNQRIVLAGYSQGAMIMHRLFTDLINTGKTNIVRRIDGVILIADGDRNTRDDINHRGTARRLTPSGVAWGLPGVSKVRRTTFQNAPQVHSICEATDVVCHPTWLPVLSLGLFAGGSLVHTKRTTGTSAVRSASDTVAERVGQTAGLRMIVPKIVRRNGQVPARIVARSGAVCPPGTDRISVSGAILTGNGFFGVSGSSSVNPDGTWSHDVGFLDSGGRARVWVNARCDGPGGGLFPSYKSEWVTVVE
jgi:hypothetical protein